MDKIISDIENQIDYNELVEIENDSTIGLKVECMQEQIKGLLSIVKILLENNTYGKANHYKAFSN